MKIGDTLLPLTGNAQSCVILVVQDPPKKWKVEYESGKTRWWSKSHLKKYYMVKKD